MRFGYLKDPLFLFCVALYLVNRFVFKQMWPNGFHHAHLNNLICIPFWVPVMLFVQRRMGLRDSDGIPRAGELVMPVIMWSLIFEVLLPQMPGWDRLCTGDPADVMYYSLGALLAAVFWRWWYGTAQPKALHDLPEHAA